MITADFRRNSYLELGVALAGCLGLSGCNGGSDTQRLVRDVVTTSAVNASSYVREWPAGTFYASLQTSSDGIVTSASRCSPEFWAQLSSFAKSLFGIEKSATFVVTIDVVIPSGEIYDDLPLLAISEADAETGGTSCRLSGAAASANPTRITPFFRVDPNQEVKLVFDLKIIDDAQIAAVRSALSYAQQVASFMGPQSAIAGKLSSELLSGIAGRIDEGLSSAEKTNTIDRLTATLRRQTSDGTAVERISFDLARYLAGGRSSEAVANTGAVIVEFSYRPSVVADVDQNGTIAWPTNVGTLLSFRPALADLNERTYGQALDEGIVPNFNSTFLRSAENSAPSKQQMVRACDDLRSNLENRVALTPDDAAAVRYAALREKTDYFKLGQTWNDRCLSGRYLAATSLGPVANGDAERLLELNREYYSPTGSGVADWRSAINRRIRDLRQIASEGNSSALLDPTFRLTVDNPELVPVTFFDGERPTGVWSETGDRARARISLIAYGGFCGQLLTAHYTSPQTVQSMALIGRTSGLSASGFDGMRDQQGNVLVPLIVTWGAGEPARLNEVRASPVEIIREEYSNEVGVWPNSPDVESCRNIVREF
jgi:hypothetical protein